MTEKRFEVTNVSLNGMCGLFKLGNDSISVYDIARLVNELLEENEQLKKELAIYRKVASCSNCDYHNYDWYDEGDEFEVCDKGNNVNNGICEDWEEL